ncbi:MAG: DUF4923 family protein [Bacteroidales bacterium]|nr:DUF4923 family protein [Bacteroidales bacterium]MCM1147629.1 DUF4923 family protein [Bacteroidales bacterium]MCM1206420.1 DUF4923 family protein [Bacillota bacterium]MCM1509153.1 DUF4923 family protein [Clostridium sp.]
MKVNILKALMVSVMLFCANVSADAQLSELLNKVTEAVGSKSGSSSSSGSVLGKVVDIVSSKLVPTSRQIQGTWVYQSPAVVFQSNSAMAKLGGTVASTKIEEKLQTYFSKVGMTKGKMSVTFNSDKTFCVNFKNKKITGTYEISGNDVQLTFKGKTKPCSLTPQLKNGSLVVVGDATKLKDFLQNIAGSVGTTELSAVSSLMKSFNGMLVGVRFSK